jgi:Glutathione S-transferase, N-terminal domain
MHTPCVERPPETPSTRRQGQIASQLHDSKYVPRMRQLTAEVSPAARGARLDDMDQVPTLYVCHGDDGGPSRHPCRLVQEALREAGIQYEKVIAAHGSPFPFLRKGSREDLRAATGTTKLPALKLADGTVLTHTRAILSWVDDQKK